MTQIFHLSPDLESARRAINFLKASGIKEQAIAVITHNKQHLEILDAHAPDALEKSDLLGALQKGSLVGASIGLLAGLGAVFLPPPIDLIVGGRALLGLTLFGSGFGAWASSLIGISITKPEIKEYELAIKQGKLLLVVEVPAEELELIQNKLKTL
ncbi:MAG: hypothetical protein JWM09_1553 [Francisellaceae bacterium]|nr:hypothetical protein [Francisellaceae bacterium]